MYSLVKLDLHIIHHQKIIILLLPLLTIILLLLRENDPRPDWYIVTNVGLRPNQLNNLFNGFFKARGSILILEKVQEPLPSVCCNNGSGWK